MKTKTGYVCGTTWTWHMGADNDPSSQNVYPTLDSIKRNSKCWKGCGIVKLEMKVVKEYPTQLTADFKPGGDSE